MAEVDASTRRRAEYSSDASLYRVPPELVAVPRDADEVVAVVETCLDLGVPLTARGAGTSVAGNAVGPGVVMWRGRHVAEPTELAAEEASGYWLEVLQVASALQRHYRPVKMNYQTLGNAVPHLHTHLLPRFAQDPAPGRPLPFLEGERPKLPEETFRRDALALRALV